MRVHRHNLYPGADRAHRDRLRRARGAGQAGRPRRARLRSAHFSGAGRLRRQSAPGDGGHQRRRADARPPAAGAAERLRAGAAERRPAAARPRRRRRPRGPGFLPEGEDARAFRAGGRARGHRHAGRGGSAGRRDDRGAGAGLAGNSAARSRGPRPGSRFQPQGRFGLQRPHRPEGGQRTVHRDRRRHHRQPPRIAQRGRRRPSHRSATC